MDRRNFIKRLTAGSAGLALVPNLSITPVKQPVKKIEKVYPKYPHGHIDGYEIITANLNSYVDQPVIKGSVFDYDGSMINIETTLHAETYYSDQITFEAIDFELVINNYESIVGKCIVNELSHSIREGYCICSWDCTVIRYRMIIQ